MSTSPHHLGNHDRHTPEAAVMPQAAGRAVLGLDRSLTGHRTRTSFPLTFLGCRGDPTTLNTDRGPGATGKSRRG